MPHDIALLGYIKSTKLEVLYTSNTLQNKHSIIIQLKKTFPGKVIAFYAILTETLRNVPQSTIIDFEKVLRSKWWKRIWPAHGKIATAYLSGFAEGKLMAKISNHSEASACQNTSGHLVIKLKKGSKFLVQNISGITSELIHKEHTFVSGCKLSAC